MKIKFNVCWRLKAGVSSGEAINYQFKSSNNVRDAGKEGQYLGRSNSRSISAGVGSPYLFRGTE